MRERIPKCKENRNKGKAHPQLVSFSEVSLPQVAQMCISISIAVLYPEFISLREMEYPINTNRRPAKRNGSYRNDPLKKERNV